MDSDYFKSEAKKALEGKWQTFSVCVLIYIAISSVMKAPSLILDIDSLMSDLSQTYLISKFSYTSSLPSGLELSFISNLLSFVDILATAFLLNHLIYALRAMALKATKNEEIEVSNIFDGFHNYKNVLMLSLLEGLYIFLWMLLFIIPGFIKAISYSMTHFILAENPDMRPSDAIRESEKLMYGHKWEFFVLQLSFLGWILLSVITLNISSIWSDPYFYTAQAEFYQAIKKEKYGDLPPFEIDDEDEEIYPEYPYEYTTYKSEQEHETQLNNSTQAVEPTYTYLGASTGMAEVEIQEEFSESESDSIR